MRLVHGTEVEYSAILYTWRCLQTPYLNLIQMILWRWHQALTELSARCADKRCTPLLTARSLFQSVRNIYLRRQQQPELTPPRLINVQQLMLLGSLTCPRKSAWLHGWSLALKPMLGTSGLCSSRCPRMNVVNWNWNGVCCLDLLSHHQSNLRLRHGF